MGNFTFKKVCCLFLLSLLSIGTVKADNESYYIIGPQTGNFGFDINGGNFNAWLKMEQDATNPNVYSIRIPGRYPAIDFSSFSSGKESDISSNISTWFGKDGLKFLVAKGSTVQKVVNQDGIPKYEDIQALLAPKVSKTNSDGNVWISKGTTTGTLASSYDGFGLHLDLSFYKLWRKTWEIRYAYDIKDADIVCTTTKHEWNWYTYNYTISSNYKQLDGSIIFSINVKDNTWTATYDPDTRVSYLAVIPSTEDGNLPGKATKTYIFTQTKNSDGAYTNIYSNPSVYFDGESKYLFLSNYAANQNAHDVIVSAYNNQKTKNFDMAMPAAVDAMYSNYYNEQGNLSWYGPSNRCTKDVLEGYRHVLSNAGSVADVPDVDTKGNYAVKWYPFLGGTSESRGVYTANWTSYGIVKWGTEDAGMDIPTFNAIYICPGKTNPALTDSIQLTYYPDSDAYIAKLSGSQFGKGTFYFKDGYDTETQTTLAIQKDKGYLTTQQYQTLINGRKWSEDATVNTNPTEANPNKIIISNTHVDNEYAGKELTNNSTYIIKLKVLSDGSASYSITTASGNNLVTIRSLAGELIRTYSNASNAYKVPEGCKAYVVNGCYNNESKLVAILKRIYYIPKSTGIILDAGEGTVAKNVELEVFDASSYSNYGKSYSETYTGDNYLIPTTGETIGASEYANGQISARNFFLGKWSDCTIYDYTDDYLGFFRVSNGSRTQNNKAYLRVPISLINKDIKTGTYWSTIYEAKGLQFVYDNGDSDSDATGISTVSTTESDETNDDAYYTLNGCKVDNPTNGVFIHKGKTVIIGKQKK